MFKKIISNLPFNPALLSQVGFYVHRLRKEESIRRFSFGLVALAFMLQIFVSITPPQNTLATSGNDIVYGGGSQSQIALDVRNNTDQLHHQDLQAIYGYYGITANDIAQGQDSSISTVGSNDYYSIGRTNRDEHDIRVTISGASTSIFSRRLDGWAHKNWSAIKIPGKNLWVLKDCGNVVTVGNFSPPAAPPPNLHLSKDNIPKGKVKPGELIKYTLLYSNTGGQAPLTAILDNLPSNTSFVSAYSPFWKQIGTTTNLKFIPDNAFAVLSNTNGQSYPITITVKVRTGSTNGASVCNNASIVTYQDASHFRTWDNDSVCNNVAVTCPNGQPMPTSGNCTVSTPVHTPTPTQPSQPVTPPSQPPTPTPTQPVLPTAACVSLDDNGQETDFKRLFTTQLSLEHGATVQTYTYDFGDGTAVKKVSSSSATNSTDHTYKQPGTYLVVVSANTSVGVVTSPACHLNTVVKSTTVALPILRKTARNVTENINDANNTTAAGGDVIEYTLTTTNPTNKTIKSLHLRAEDLSDISEYADLDMSSISGASFDAKTKVLSWADNVDLAGNASVVKTFRVTVKNPIPQTPASKSDSQSYDLIMYNEYGNPVTIKLPATPGKIIEQTLTTSIPQTGGGTGVFVSTAIVMIAGYLYARARTMKHELELVKVDYTTGGL